MHPTDTKPCFSSHLGPWLCKTDVLKAMVDAVKTGMLKEAKSIEDIEYQSTSVTVKGTVAIIPITGVMVKKVSKFQGGVSTIEVRRAIREAVAMDEVETIIFDIDSPGGMVAGTMELANEIASISKRTIAQVSDCCASAAYWVASQCDEIRANKLAEVGSIGTYCVLYDTSESYDREGIKVHLVSSGGVKGAMNDGIPLSEDAIKEVQAQVDAITKEFIWSISTARKKDMTELATGQTWIASEALALGLIDRIASFDETMTEIATEARQSTALRRSRQQRLLSQSQTTKLSSFLKGKKA